MIEGRLKMKQIASLWLGIALLVCVSCAARTVWMGQPSVLTIVRDDYKITLEPGYSKEGDFFTHFIIGVVNRGPETLTIDWSRTRYLHNGAAKGHFIFEGVDKKSVQRPPSDSIPPGAQLKKEIWPLSLLVIAPYRSNNVPAGQTGFKRGVLPAGNNTLDLALVKGNRIIREKLVMTLIEKRAS